MEITSNSNNVENDRTLCLVKGYHQDSYPPKIAYDIGLRFRFAVVLDSYRRDKVDMFFDHLLFLQIVKGLSGAIKHDSIGIEMEEEEHFNSLDELAKFYGQQEEIDWEPPVQIKFSFEDQLVCLEETEFWSRSGGPKPYHDSYTISFYTKDDRAEEFCAISHRQSDKIGAIVTGFHEGEPHKEPWKSPKTWWQRLLGK